MKKIASLLMILAAACSKSAPVAEPPAPAPQATTAPPTTPPPTTPPPTTAPPTTPPPATAFNPEGYYDLRITFGGTGLPIALEMWKENGAWRGSAGNSSLGFANVTAVTQDREDPRDMRITLVAENGPTFYLSLYVNTDSTVEGRWEGNGDGSPVSGRKTK